MNLGFLDFTSLNARRHFCREELRLNRRLAPQLYLDLVSIGGTPAHPTLGGSTPVIEYAVKMRQFDRNAEFDRLASNRQLNPNHIDRLAQTIADFHLAANRMTKSNPDRIANRIEQLALENFIELSQFEKPPETVKPLARLREWTEQKFFQCKASIKQRSESGFIRECHGDLHLGNIVVIDGQPIPFDCIEFNENLRWIDVIDEIAFLLMDLRAHDLQGYGYRLLNRYLQITGDYKALPLLDYYQVYRAIVRAKVALLARDPIGGDRIENDSITHTFENYIAVAQASIVQNPPVLMITHGLSGSGKSTIASQIAENLPAIQLRSDIERKRLAETDELQSQDLYGERANSITYCHLAETAAVLLESGYTVIVDATFLKQNWRDQFRLLADKSKSHFLILDMRAPQQELRNRIVERLRAENDPSDADLEVLEIQTKHRDPLTLSEKNNSLSVETMGEIDLSALIRQIITRRDR